MPRLRTPQGHTLSLPPRRVSVGESPACGIPITAGLGLADIQFHLQPWESGHFLEDAGSGIPTSVNGRPVSWAPLKHGDVITAGELSMVYESEDSPPLPEFPAPPVVIADPELTEDAPPAATINSQDHQSANEAPPSWLPPEAMLPPVPPAEIPENAVPAGAPAAHRRSGKRLIAVILIIVAVLVGAGLLLMRHQ